LRGLLAILKAFLVGVLRKRDGSRSGQSVEQLEGASPQHQAQITPTLP
jgi:hypothetical protein